MLFVVVKTTESEEWTSLFITVNKYRFCISVIGYINIQIIGIGYKTQYRSITTCNASVTSYTAANPVSLPCLDETSLPADIPSYLSSQGTLAERQDGYVASESGGSHQYISSSIGGFYTPPKDINGNSLYIHQGFSKSGSGPREFNPDPPPLDISSALVSLRPWHTHTHTRTHTGA